MRSRECTRLEKLYMTQVEAALSKRIYAYNLLEEADSELARATSKLKNLYRGKTDGDEDNGKE